MEQQDTNDGHDSAKAKVGHRHPKAATVDKLKNLGSDIHTKRGVSHPGPGGSHHGIDLGEGSGVPLQGFWAGDGLGVHTRSIDGLSVHTRSVRKQLHIGDNVTLPCNIIGPDFNPFTDQILWYKLVDGSEIAMNTGGILKAPFINAGRYTITPDMKQGPEPKVSMPIKIQGVTLADTGMYMCQLISAPNKIIGNVTHSLTVLAPVDTLAFTTNETHIKSGEDDTVQTTFEFSESQPSYISCKAQGGNPKPTLKIFRGKLDITNEFKHSVNESVSGPLGLQVTHYTVELFNPEFKAPVTFRGEHMRCVAKIHKAQDLKRTKSASIDVKFGPRFDCESSVMAWPGDENVTLSCSLSANPPVDIKTVAWRFSKPAHNDTVEEITLSSRETSNGAHLVQISLENTGKVATTLTIRNATEDTFQTYTIDAANDIDSRHFEMTLTEAFTTLEATTVEPSTEAPTTPQPKDTIHPANGEEKPAVAVTGGSTRCAQQGWNFGASVLRTLILSLAIVCHTNLKDRF